MRWTLFQSVLYPSIAPRNTASENNFPGFRISRCRYRLGQHRLGLKLSVPLRCSIRAEALAAQDWSARRRLEGHRILFPALVASNVESLAFTCWSSRAAKIGPARIAAGLAAFWMSQITFLVVLLFPFRKCEGSVALRTRYFEVWHRGFSKRGNRGGSTLCSSERWRRVSFNHEVMVRKRCFSNTTPKSYASRRVSWRECTPANRSIQTICVAEDRQGSPDVWRGRNTTLTQMLDYQSAHGLLISWTVAWITY